ncbi:glycosyltransferase family 2 protein [Gloeobacter kilaueensis]|uniref:Glycosyl transferase family 2 n=1 Tax=Gloeobacter kilaueensis (strain ATCC BAA-2537 / CCAP 1431/1 / ULC 316 / JS1) TaxID=1183438 RepID=U5QM03_GLOK1|nr:glycosyltransferase family 2 protein [Gloeobacter kilaueensis]AGY58644.1 hypothetical protein GKIL_2398 [Gloeobacter kilaueensis JS1]
MSRIHAVCLLKNEGDVVAQTLRYASRFCHRIYVFDTGSSDDSWDQVQALAGEVIVPYRREAVPFSDGLRAQVYNAVRSGCAIGDWFYILDADEFLAEDPTGAIQRAEREGAQQINTLQYNFYYTDTDWQEHLKGGDSRSRPIAQRRRYYRFVNVEQRLFRISDDLVWPETTDAEHPSGYIFPLWPAGRKKCSSKIPNRHYQYRDPEQIQLRLLTRQAARAANDANFVHYRSLDAGVNWMQSIVPSRQLHYYRGDGHFRYTLRERAQIFKERLGSRDFFRFDFLAT